jgi:DNA-binding Xre family transcriptional regulator
MNPTEEKKQRQRDSLRLSKKGQSLVREALSSKGWSQEKWVQNLDTYVSISTAKRLLKGEKIDRVYFEALCKVLYPDPNDLIALLNDQIDSPIPLIPLLVPPVLIHIPPELSSTQHSGTHFQGFMITGTFSPNKLAEIKVTLVHLEKLLRNDCTFTLMPDKNYLAVSGKFSEDKKPHVEVALMHLKKLLLEHCITAEWME